MCVCVGGGGGLVEASNVNLLRSMHGGVRVTEVQSFIDGGRGGNTPSSRGVEAFVEVTVLP